MSLAVDEPILINPFEEPKGYWVYEEGPAMRLAGRHMQQGIEYLKGFCKNLGTKSKRRY